MHAVAGAWHMCHPLGPRTHVRAVGTWGRGPAIKCTKTRRIATYGSCSEHERGAGADGALSHTKRGHLRCSGCGRVWGKGALPGPCNITWHTGLTGASA
jgi:hypothetical protein